jgi:hypothetical protein
MNKVYTEISNPRKSYIDLLNDVLNIETKIKELRDKSQYKKEAMPDWKMTKFLIESGKIDDKLLTALKYLIENRISNNFGSESVKDRYNSDYEDKIYDEYVKIKELLLNKIKNSDDLKKQLEEEINKKCNTCLSENNKKCADNIGRCKNVHNEYVINNKIIANKTLKQYKHDGFFMKNDCIIDPNDDEYRYKCTTSNFTNCETCEVELRAYNSLLKKIADKTPTES